MQIISTLPPGGKSVSLAGMAGSMNWTGLYLLSEWVIRITMLAYVPQRRSPAAARAWLLFIFLLPWPGLVIYTVIGRIQLPKRRMEMQKRASYHIRQVQEQMPERPRAGLDLPVNLQPVPVLASQLGDFDPHGGNRVALLPAYEESIGELIADIGAARHHVNLLFYIYAADGTGRRVTDALAAAAGRGVQCRVLMDAVGSESSLRSMAPEMRAAGIEVQAMLPVGFFRRNAGRFDLRNHRKIAIVDGRIGYVGSQNLVDPFFVKDYPNEELMARVTGPVVAQFQAVFLADYYFETGRLLPENEFFPEVKEDGGSPAQLVPSGPGYGRENGQELIVEMLYAARKRVVITTPYFVPDVSVLQAIRSAARRGVEIHLVLSAHSNHIITQLAQQSFYEEMLGYGVEIHLYEPHFLHAKHISVDDELALIGSTNIDIRSFALNAEINMLVYDRIVAAELRGVQERYFSRSRRLSLEEWERRSLGARIAQNTARLADSLL